MIFNTVEIEEAIETCPEKLKQLLEVINFYGTYKSEKGKIISAIDNFFIEKLKKNTLSGSFKFLLQGIADPKNLTVDEMIIIILENYKKIINKWKK